MAISSDYRSSLAEAAVAAYLIVKPGVAAGSVVPAAAATDKLMGTNADLDKAIGELADIGVSAVHKVKLGGTVAAGDALTSDANGKAIATVTTGNRIIGYAEIAGVLNDVITYRRSLGNL
jgi:hypothetical protein